MSWIFSRPPQYSQGLKILFALVGLHTVDTLLVPAGIAKAPQRSGSSSYTETKSSLADNFQGDQTCDPERVESARRIIEQLKIFIGKADAQHKRIQQELLLAEKLKGEANMFMQNKTNPAPTVKLTGAALEEAKKQYASDLQAFAEHATEYQALLKRFQVEVGECHANQEAYKNQVTQYTIHTEQFHNDTTSLQRFMPKIIIIEEGIKPPHICGVLQLTKRQADEYYARLKADQDKMIGVEGELARQDNKLANENLKSEKVGSLALKESNRERREQEVYADFARLREEHANLLTERSFLNLGNKATSAKVVHSTTQATSASSSVHGKIKAP